MLRVATGGGKDLRDQTRQASCAGLGSEAMFQTVGGGSDVPGGDFFMSANMITALVFGVPGVYSDVPRNGSENHGPAIGKGWRLWVCSSSS